jgi:hypothetical protein
VPSESKEITWCITCTIRRGNTALLWHNCWNCSLACLTESLPHLHSFAIGDSVSVKQAIELQEPLDDSVPPSHIFGGFWWISNTCRHPSTHPDQPQRTWLLELFLRNDHFSSTKIYASNLSNIQTPAIFNWIWSSKCQNKLRFFSWLRKNFYITVLLAPEKSAISFF